MDSNPLPRSLSKHFYLLLKLEAGNLPKDREQSGLFVFSPLGHDADTKPLFVVGTQEDHEDQPNHRHAEIYQKVGHGSGSFGT